MSQFRNLTVVGMISLTMFITYCGVAWLVHGDCWPAYCEAIGYPPLWLPVWAYALSASLIGALIALSFLKLGLRERLPFVTFILCLLVFLAAGYFEGGLRRWEWIRSDHFISVGAKIKTAHQENK